MAGFFKKALGVFVEFDEDTAKTETPVINEQVYTPQPKISSAQHLNEEDIDKFEKHFDKLFEETNLPGPDYYEFFKMMETLEPHIHDEKARISATFSSLSIQGMTKEKLIDTAKKYMDVVQSDRANFEKALQSAGSSEVDQRKSKLQELEQMIQKNSEMIQKLTKEISDGQVLIGKLKIEVQEEENKFNKNRSGYNIACEAMLTKITTDIQKIQTTI
jgi:chromosome segregation ATPase